MSKRSTQARYKTAGVVNSRIALIGVGRKDGIPVELKCGEKFVSEILNRKQITVFLLD